MTKTERAYGGARASTYILTYLRSGGAVEAGERCALNGFSLMNVFF